VLPFDDVMASTAADRFAVDVLVRALSATDVVVGADFRFGNRGAGDVRLLTELGGRHGFLATAFPFSPASPRPGSVACSGPATWPPPRSSSADHIKWRDGC
jgi:hypothetical protein